MALSPDAARQISIVRTLNMCLRPEALRGYLTAEEWDELARLVESGQLVFSVEGTGFHLKANESGSVVHDCSP